MEARDLSRRDALRLGGGGALGLLWTGDSSGRGASRPGSESGVPPTFAASAETELCEGPCFTHLSRRLRQAEEKAISRQAVLRDRTAARAHVEDVRRRASRCLESATWDGPLEPRTAGKLERGAYRIEKLIFESHPGFLATADLYLPAAVGARPAVLGLCGHGAAGKAAEHNQAFAQGLARRGAVVLLIDPPGQGERLLYPAPAGGSLLGAGAAEHRRAQIQLLPLGEHLASWMVADARRGLDLLAERPEVDPDRLGVVGHSGGGAIAAWLAAVDRRLKFVACNCFLSGFRRNFENHQTSDAEMLPPGALEQGLEQADFLAAAAPAPLLILAQERDFFDVRGAEEGYSRLAELYGLLGAKEAVRFFPGPAGHGFGPENRAALELFVAEVAGLPAGNRDQKAATVELEKRIDLRATPGGQVAELGSRPLHTFTGERAARLAAERPALRGPALAAAARRLLRLPPRPALAPGYRVLRPRRRGASWTTAYALEVEPGLEILIHRSSRRRHPARPPKTEAPAVLFLGPVARPAADLDPGSHYFGEPRGLGSAEEDFLAAHALLLGEPLCGRRTGDILRMIDWLSSFGHREVSLWAAGGAVVPALFAALLDERISALHVDRRPPLFAEIAAQPATDPMSAAVPPADTSLASTVPGVLESFDLDDVYAELGSRLAVSGSVSRP